MFFSRKAFVTAIFFGALLFSLPAQAFTIQPLRYRVSIDPGETTKVSVTVLNDETTARHFRISVAGVEQDETGRPIFGSSLDSAEKWVKPNIETFSLNPGGKKVVIFTITAPPPADPGSHFLALIVEPFDGKNGEVGLSARSATLVSLTVAGVVNESLGIDRFTPLTHLSTSGEWSLEGVLTNRGTVSVKPETTLIVKNIIGEIVSGQPLPLNSSILPKSTRLVAQKIKLDPTHVRLPGWYTIQLVAHYGLSKSSVSATTLVWYFPFWSSAPIIACFLGIGFFLIIRRRR